MEKRANEPEIKLESVSKKSIAIIGMSTRFPQADSANAFWENLASGKDAIREFPISRRKDTDPFLRGKGLSYENISYIKGAFLEGIDLFDYRFFGLSHREASLMDPCQRLFLQAAWQAIEDSGYGGNALTGSNTGVYLGFSNDFDTETNYKRYIAELEPESMSLAVTGNMKAIIGSRLSYLLDLRGPNIIVDTTCSSSLVAIHSASKAIRSGECDMAIAGGIELHLLPVKVSDRERMGIESSDYKTRSFDDSSDGAGNGEGVGVVVLKSLDRAIRDGDSIYAVIKGSAVNQDGSSIGLTAPNASAQEQVILRAWQDSGIDPSKISYIEAHGSGTTLGDPIEAEGLTRAFLHHTERKQFCGIGSVKTSLGHLGSCAGIAGLIKTTLALYHQKLPPSLHFMRPNRKINFKSSPLYVVDELKDWVENEDSIRFSGVSSFGLSGTNCHIVLEERPQENVRNGKYTSTGNEMILPISAESKWSLECLIKEYDKWLAETHDIDLLNLCYTASLGRGHHSYRLAITFSNHHDLRNTIQQLAELGIEEADISNVAYSEFNGKRNQGLDFEETVQMSHLVDSIHNESEMMDLTELARAYVKGKDVLWDRIYPEGRRIRIPVYPFEQTRCWLNIPAQDLYFHSISWRSFPKESLDMNTSINGTILLMKDKYRRADLYRQTLVRDGLRVIEVNFGVKFEKVSETSYVLSHSQEDYDQLLDELKIEKVTHVVHMSSLSFGHTISSLEEMDESQNRGVLSLFYLTKALLRKKWKHKVQLLLLGYNVNEVTKREESLFPEPASLMGLGKVISHEYPNLVCRYLDIDVSTSDQDITNVLVNEELPYILASREGQFYTEMLGPLNSQEHGQEQIAFKNEGAYLITGGTGGMAIEIAKFMSSKHNLNLVFVSRSSFPNRDLWEKKLDQNIPKKLRESILNLLEIENNGSKIMFYSADVANEEQMSSVIADIKQKFGRINGIVHCAGVAGNGFIINKKETVFNEVLTPKIRGTWILDRLTIDDPPDFLLLFSSISTLMAAVGQGDYTAANAYLNAFAQARTKQGRRTLSINWAMWKETGMAIDYNVQNDSYFRELYTVEALLAFDNIIHTKASNVVVGELKHEEMVEVMTNDRFDYLSPKLQNMIAVSVGSNIEAKESDFIKVAKVTEVQLKGKQSFSTIEEKVAFIWSDLMGLESVSVHDNFYDIGGNSILATHLLRALDEAYPTLLDITDIFSYPTISLMSEYIESRLTGEICVETKDDSLDELLDRLSEGELSIEEANQLMKSVGEDQWKK